MLGNQEYTGFLAKLTQLNKDDQTRTRPAYIKSDSYLDSQGVAKFDFSYEPSRPNLTQYLELELSDPRGAQISMSVKLTVTGCSDNC